MIKGPILYIWVCTGLAQISYGWRYPWPQNEASFWVLKDGTSDDTADHTFQLARQISVPDDMSDSTSYLTRQIQHVRLHVPDPARFAFIITIPVRARVQGSVPASRCVKTAPESGSMDPD